MIDDGLEVEFDGLEDVSIKIRDFAMTCTANANVNILDVEATATVEIDLDIPTIDLGAEFGESLTINSCTANVDINSIDVQNLRIQFGNIDLQIPDSLTDVIVDQIDEAVIELIDGQADQGKCTLLDALNTCCRLGYRTHRVLIPALCDALSSGTIPGFATRKRGRYLTGNRQGRELQNIDATVSLEEGFCQDITVRQVFATSEQKTTEALDVLVEIDQIETECFGTVTFEVIGYSGSLNFEASVRAPTLDLDVLLLSTNLNRELPSSGCVTDCRSSVRVDSLQFDDLKVKGIPKDIVQVVVDALRDPVSEVVESLGGDGKCATLS